MKILALDLGTQTGWACWDGYRIESGHQSFALERNESSGMRYLKFNAWMQRIWAPLRLDLIAFEQAHHRGGKPTEVLAGFTTRVEEFCARLDIEHVSVHSQTLKKYATGKGNADKASMLYAAAARWPEQLIPGSVLTDDQADALWILQWARKKFDS